MTEDTKAILAAIAGLGGRFDAVDQRLDEIGRKVEAAALRSMGFTMTVMPRVSEAEAWEEAERLSKCPP